MEAMIKLKNMVLRDGRGKKRSFFVEAGESIAALDLDDSQLEIAEMQKLSKTQA